MAKTPPSHANPIMLKWAREWRELDIEAVAKLEKVDVEVVKRWESGEESPTVARLRRLQGRYKFPMHVFYLPAPPPFKVVEDFRSIASSKKSHFSWQLKMAKGRSRNKADPWIILQAQEAKAIVVTDEKWRENVNPRKPISLPNVCKEWGVKWMGIPDFLEANGLKFEGYQVAK